MKNRTLILVAATLCAGLGLIRPTAAVASEYHILHESPAMASFCAFSTCASINHTWAESFSSDAGCQNNETESYPNFNYCGVNSASGCRLDANMTSWLGTTSCNRSLFQTCYRGAALATYAWNGVCHQATNRALAQTPVPFVNFLPVGGGGISYNIFHYYGTSWPWGNWYGAPC